MNNFLDAARAPVLGAARTPQAGLCPSYASYPAARNTVQHEQPHLAPRRGHRAQQKATSNFLMKNTLGRTSNCPNELFISIPSGIKICYLKISFFWFLLQKPLLRSWQDLSLIVHLSGAFYTCILCLILFSLF